MKMKQLFLLSLVVGLIMLPTLSTALAWDTTVAFGDTGPYAGLINEYSPNRTDDSGFTEAFQSVTSKYNQPRHVDPGNSNPHQGVDLASTQKVWSVYYGWVTEVVTESSGVRVTIRVDGNGDGVQNDNLYVTYRHLADIRVSAGQSVTPFSLIAGHAYSDHAHFGNRSNIAYDGNYEWIQNEPYYRDNSSSQWYYGWDLDEICQPQFDYRYNIVKAVIYARDEVYPYNHYISAGDVKLYHRRSGTSTWSVSNMAKSGDISFQFDLDTVYSMGTSVDWLIRVERTDLRLSWPYDYLWAFYPAKYAQPDPVPNSTSPYCTNTVW